MIEIKQALTAEDYDVIRSLTQDYFTWIIENFPADQEKIEHYFAGLQKELDTLPGKYASPEGRLLICIHEGKPSGTVAMQKISDGICEMKRLFVLTEYHSKGIGKFLALELISQAREVGYLKMQLETNIGQKVAQGLYRRLGFQEISPYYKLPEDIKHELVFFELIL